MIKATIVLLGACIVITRLHRRSAAERHALWTAALAIATVLPVLTWLLPSWEPAWVQRAADTWPAAFERSAPSFAAGDIVVRATGIAEGRWTIVGMVPVLWAAVSVLLLLKIAMQAWHVTRLTSSGIAAGPRPAAIGQTVADALSLPPPRLTCSERISIPLAWGVRRARVLLPPASHDWPDERVWAVCAHELAHISRGDWIVHLLAEIACRIYWFNPLFWLARNRLSRESERAADDIVIGLGASGADYASHLIEILRGARPDLSPTPAVGMVRLRRTRFGEAKGESGFERRIAALVNALVNRTQLSRTRALRPRRPTCRAERERPFDNRGPNLEPSADRR
jgi:beta-lactamase regulating signal transducer with metallopeptidase domain